MSSSSTNSQTQQQELVFGTDSQDRHTVYRSITDLYPNRSEWYNHSKQYWAQQPSTVNGMLGGFEVVHDDDVLESAQFLSKIFQNKKGGFSRVVDCGAGIGRVSTHMLVPFAEKKGLSTTNELQVELVDVNEEYLKQAEKNLKSTFPKLKLGVTNHVCGMQDYYPQEGKEYDLIWAQWVIIYLTDEDLVAFLQRCAKALKKDGASFIGIKENYNSKPYFIGDKEDSSVTRSDEHMKKLFAKAGLKLALEEDQKKFPKELFKVKMYALQPAQ